MTQWQKIGGVLIVWSLASFAIAASSSGLVCPSPVYEFGAIAATQTVEHIFLLENRGAEPITIQKVRTTCSCVQAESDRRLIEPGDTAKLAVRFIPDDRRGQVQKAVYVLTGSSSSAVCRLILEGSVQDE